MFSVCRLSKHYFTCLKILLNECFTRKYFKLDYDENSTDLDEMDYYSGNCLNRHRCSILHANSCTFKAYEVHLRIET